jgi:NADH-quinone oxidoreductase subunit L
MLGILMVWAWAGTVVFAEIAGKLPALNLHAGFLTAAALLIFCGAIGKSAQVPLHVWLPDAMEGPTPVSALIHAATMVAAGVYMLARVSFLIELAPAAQTIIAMIGVVTAFLAALIGTQQDDIKRILAYSTLSQLGYMILAIGVAAPGAAMFHLWTHAFFKALLFLGAGAIIHALHHEQDIWKMGGLSKKMRLTFGTFAIGTLALTGCPFLSGFYSKDAILLAVYQSKAGVILFPVALLTAFLTAFYMTRLVVVVFFGKARSDAATHGHDGPIRMSGPLAILALLSVIAGWHLFAGGALGHYQGSLDQLHQGAGRTLVPFLATIAFLGGTVAGWLLYAGQDREPVVFSPLKNKLYFDEVYTALIAGTQGVLASIAAFIDKWVIDGVLVRGLSGATWGAGFVLRLAQFGNLQGYALLFAAGVIALIYYMVFA